MTQTGIRTVSSAVPRGTETIPKNKEKCAFWSLIKLILCCSFLEDCHHLLSKSAVWVLFLTFCSLRRDIKLAVCQLAALLFSIFPSYSSIQHYIQYETVFTNIRSRFTELNLLFSARYLSIILFYFRLLCVFATMSTVVSALSSINWSIDRSIDWLIDGVNSVNLEISQPPFPDTPILMGCRTSSKNWMWNEFGIYDQTITCPVVRVRCGSKKTKHLITKTATDCS